MQNCKHLLEEYRQRSMEKLNELERPQEAIFKPSTSKVISPNQRRLPKPITTRSVNTRAQARLRENPATSLEKSGRRADILLDMAEEARKITCKLCGLRIKGRNGLRTHMKTHKEDNVFHTP